MNIDLERWADHKGPAHSFWGMLYPADQQELFRNGALARFPSGIFLCRQGDRSQHVMILLSGRVKLLANAYEGYETVLGVRGPGDIVGALAAIDGLPRSATLVASEDVEVLTVSSDRFLTVCRERAAVNLALLRVLSAQIRKTRIQQIKRGNYSATQKLASLLVDLVIKYGKPTEHGLALELSLDQQQIASMISVSRETVVRALRELRGQSLISTQRRKITVLSLEGLRKIANDY